MIKKLLFLLAVLALAGYVLTKQAGTGVEAQDKKEELSHVRCWSGGVVIYDGYASKNAQLYQGNYTQFRDKSDGKIKTVTGDCLIEHNE